MQPFSTFKITFENNLRKQWIADWTSVQSGAMVASGRVLIEIFLILFQF